MIRAMRPLLAEGWALVGGFLRFGGQQLGVTVVLMIVGGFLEGVGLALLVPVFSLLAPDGGGRWQRSIVEQLAVLRLDTRMAQLAAVLGAFCLLVILRAAVLSRRDRMMSDLSLGFVDHRRLMVVRDLARARWSALARLRHARIAHILSSEIGRLAIACSILLHMMAAAIMLVTQAVLLLVLSPLVTGLMVVLSLLGLLLLIPLSRRAAITGKSPARFAFRIVGEAAQFMGGLKLAVAHDMAEPFVRQIEAESSALRAEQDAQQRFQSHVAIASTTIASLLGAGVIVTAVWFGVSTVTLLAALVVLVRMSGPVRMLQLNVQQLFGVLPAFTTVRNLHDDLGDAAPLLTGPAAHRLPMGTIRFEDVAFGYPHAPQPVFTALSLSIAAGEMVGLSGPSGTGKTSFVDLLTGLLEPQAGRITIGDVPLGPATLAHWRRNLAYVAQDSYLINDSIRRNLTWGSDTRPEAALWQALEHAGAAALVAAMPAGLDTVVDERGARLSGGERQRIALARAILRNPALLILDEATNAIDIATEQAVIANIRRALPTATILVIAHRDETLAACDRVLHLSEGRDTRPDGGDDSR